MANAPKACAPVGAVGNPLRMISARMEDWTVVMSYFCAAARSANTLSYDEGISGGIGYSMVTRARTISTSSDKRTTGNPSTISLADVWVSEKISLKTCAEEASADLRTGKLTKSDD